MYLISGYAHSLQDFIWQVHKRNDENTSRTSFASFVRSEKSPVSLDVFNNLLGSFLAKKAYVHLALLLAKLTIPQTLCTCHHESPRNHGQRREEPSYQEWRGTAEACRGGEAVACSSRTDRTY